MTNRTDELISRALDGNNQAYETLIKEHDRKVFSICLKITGSVEEAKDATQDTFIKVFRYLHKYDRSKNFNAWLSKIAVNCCYSIIKTRKTGHVELEVSEYESNKIDSAYKTATNTSDDTDNKLDNQKALSAVMNILQTLPVKQRTVFILKELEGYSTKEAAQISGCSRITVRRNLSEARNKVKNALMSKYPELFNH